MRVTVFGAGSVGGHMAARLVMSGHAVSVIARGAHLAAMQQRGLVLNVEDKAILCPVMATDRPEHLGHQDLVILSVKGTALPAAIDGVRPLVGPGTLVLFVMNGLPWWFLQGLNIEATDLCALLDPGGNAADLVPLDRTIWGVISSGGMIAEAGVIRNTTPHNNALKLGYPDGREDAFLGRLVTMLVKAGYKTDVSHDIRRDIWLKLIVNVSLSMVGALIERDNRATVADPETRAVVIACMREMAAIGRAIGIEVVTDFEAMTDPARAAPHRTSFLQDLKAGRPLELPSTILAARQIGRLVGLDSPHLTTVAALIAARSAGGRDAA